MYEQDSPIHQTRSVRATCVGPSRLLTLFAPIYSALLACALLVGVALTAAPASAAPTVGHYPPVSCAVMGVSSTVVSGGQTITVTGSGFAPSQTVTIELNTVTIILGHVVTSANGTFTIQVTIPPGLSGVHLLSAVGALSPGCSTTPSDSLSIVDSRQSTPPSQGGGLPFTGTNVLAGLIAAGALLAAGLLLLRGGRRRKSTHG